MTEKIFIISMMVFAIWFSMQPSEIFEKLGDWLHDHLPKKLHSPAFDCPVCMVPYYGSVIYWLLFMPMKINSLWPLNVTLYWMGFVEWFTVIIAAMGLNAVIVKLWPSKEKIRKTAD